MAKTLTTCTRCDGIGCHENTMTHDRLTGHTCTDCDGTGQIEMPISGGLVGYAEMKRALLEELADRAGNGFPPLTGGQ